MENIASPVPNVKTKGVRAVLIGGLVAGGLDLTAACVSNYLQWGLAPVRIFQAIASGLFGAESYNGGAAAATLGVFLHFAIALGAATVFYLVSRKFELLIERAAFSGALFGVLVYWFMQLVVLPLSAYPHKINFSFREILVGNIIHIFCVGLPIAVAVRHFSERSRSTEKRSDV